MKRILFLFFLTPLSLFSQVVDMGEILISINVTATLNFDGSTAIDYAILGNNPKDADGNPVFFEDFKRLNTYTVKALVENTPTTSLVVRLEDGRMYMATVKYGEGGKMIYNFADSKIPLLTPSNVEENTQTSNAKESVKPNSIVVERLKNVISRKDKYFNFGAKDNGLNFQVAHIVNDDKFTYIKLKINNKTGNDYIIDGIHIKYQLGKRKGLKSSEVGNEERPEVIHKEGLEVVKAYSEETIGVACPVFAVGEKGVLKIQIIEQKGNRTVTIEIEGKDIVNLDVY
jgi:hypothetical protein